MSRGENHKPIPLSLLSRLFVSGERCEVRHGGGAILSSNSSLGRPASRHGVVCRNLVSHTYASRHHSVLRCNASSHSYLPLIDTLNFCLTCICITYLYHVSHTCICFV